MIGLRAYFAGGAILFLPLITCNTFTVLTSGGNFFCSPVLCLRGSSSSSLGVELAGLLKDPTFSMGMICRFIGGAVDLTYFVQNLV